MKIKRKYSIFQLSEKEREDLPYEYPDWFYDSRNKIPRGICLDCGTDTKNKRRRTCGDICKMRLASSPYGMQANSLRKAIHKRDRFECKHCQAKFMKTTKAGLQLPMIWGEVDHIIPLFQGGTDDSYNMQLLCYDCHKVKTINERKKDGN